MIAASLSLSISVNAPYSSQFEFHIYQESMKEATETLHLFICSPKTFFSGYIQIIICYLVDLLERLLRADVSHGVLEAGQPDPEPVEALVSAIDGEDGRPGVGLVVDISIDKQIRR